MCQRTVHIQVYLHSCSICSGISGGWWEWQSMDLHVVNPKVWLHHHVGNDWACTPKSTSSENISIIIWRRCGAGSEIPKFNRASCAGKQRHCKHFPTDTPLSVQKEGNVPTIHALMAQDRYVAQLAYITLKQLVHITPERIAQLYEVFNDDMRGNLSELHSEVDHWKAIWEMVNVAEKPDTLDDSRNQPWPISQHVHCCHSMDGDVCIDSHGRSQCCVSRTICALQWQRSACRDWSWCTSTRTQSWMLNASFISSLIRKTGT